MQVIRFFLYTILYWTLPRDRVLEPEEEDEQPLTPESDSKPDVKKEPNKDGKDRDVELGTRLSADSSTRRDGPFSIAADRTRSITHGSMDVGRRQSLGREMNRHSSLETLGSQELFGFRDALAAQQKSPGGTAHGLGSPAPGRAERAAALEGRSSLQSNPSFNKSPRAPKKQVD